MDGAKGQENLLPKAPIIASINENKITSPSEMISNRCLLCHRVVSLHLDLADLAWPLVFMAHLCHSYQIPEIVTPSLSSEARVESDLTFITFLCHTKHTD